MWGHQNCEKSCFNKVFEDLIFSMYLFESYAQTIFGEFQRSSEVTGSQIMEDLLTAYLKKCNFEKYLIYNVESSHWVQVDIIFRGVLISF